MVARISSEKGMLLLSVQKANLGVIVVYFCASTREHASEMTLSKWWKYNTAMQSQKSVSAYFTSKQIVQLGLQNRILSHQENVSADQCHKMSCIFTINTATRNVGLIVY